MIKVTDLTKYYGTFRAVNKLSFTIEKGHIYGLLGPNGAGKTTTMNMLTGTLACSEGLITYEGQDILELDDLYRRHIGYLPENPPLYPELTPREYLTFVASAKGIDKKSVREKVNGVMKETMLSGVADRVISNLSKGYKQRVGIAQAMLGDPELIILDEPTVGLDPKQVVQVRQLIKNLAKKQTVILSSHILSEIEELCDTIMIISSGELVACDTLENLQKQYAGNDILTFTAVCPVARAEEILKKMTVSYEFTVNKSSQRGCEITLICPKKKDPREGIFFAFAKAGIPIISMNYRVVTLEDLFLKATQDSSQAALDSDSDERLGEGSVEEAVTNEDAKPQKKQKKKTPDENEDDDDGDSYRPLFG